MSILDETELARLEALALPYARLQPSRYEDTQNICTRAVPALVAEVRRLRAKIDPLDWWAECVYVMRWLNESRPFDDPFFEAMKSVDAAERAVHADRE